jgi:hypothetical protein
MRKLLKAAAILVLFMGTAHAQYSNQSDNAAGSSSRPLMMPDFQRHLTPEEARQEREIESQYKQTINEKIPDKKPSNDPWGIVRKQQK